MSATRYFIVTLLSSQSLRELTPSMYLIKHDRFPEKGSVEGIIRKQHEEDEERVKSYGSKYFGATSSIVEISEADAREFDKSQYNKISGK